MSELLTASLIEESKRLHAEIVAGRRAQRVRELVIGLLNDGRTYEPFAYADVVELAINYDDEIQRRCAAP